MIFKNALSLKVDYRCFGRNWIENILFLNRNLNEQAIWFCRWLLLLRNVKMIELYSKLLKSNTAMLSISILFNIISLKHQLNYFEQIHNTHCIRLQKMTGFGCFKILTSSSHQPLKTVYIIFSFVTQIFLQTDICQLTNSKLPASTLGNKFVKKKLISFSRWQNTICNDWTFYKIFDILIKLTLRQKEKPTSVI